MIRTWHVEMLVVGSVLASIALFRGAWTEWLCASAVLATFGHASVAERLRERDALRVQPEVDCVRWTWRYFIVKEILWAAFFVATGAYVALVGVGVFLAYPAWRTWWRKRHPIELSVASVAPTMMARMIGDYEVSWDGKTVWVNGPDGMNVARFTRTPVGTAIDIHASAETQMSGARHCVACGPGTWDEFKAGVQEHIGIEMPEEANPG
jgi:hypothetical protein